MAINSHPTGRKKEKKVELTEEEKFIQELQQEVSSYMTIHKAAYFGAVKNLDRLLDGKLTDSYDSESGNTPLILAARNGQLKAVQMLIEKGKANVNLAGFGGLTALHHACKNDHIDVVHYLIETAHANVNVEDDAGNTPIALCARMGNLKCLESVLAGGASLDHPNKRGCTAFGAAVLNGRMAIVDLLLKKPLNLNHTDKEGNTALHYAARIGYLRLVKQLLAANINRGVINTDDEKAEDVAANDAIKAAIKAT